MSEIVKIDFDEQRKDIKEHVVNYWTERAPSFCDLRKEELKSEKASLWLKELKTVLPQKKLNILDVGCGTAFFEVLLAEEGHTVTGIDLTEEMVKEAEIMIKSHGLENNARVLQMDAEELNFNDETFDLVITRNLTWTLPHPQKAYSEWHRVLKKGGLLLNFDAEHAKAAHMTNPHENNAHQDLSDAMQEKCHQIYHMLSMSALERPEWDKEILKQTGFTKVECDTGFGDRVYAQKDRFYIPERMSMIKAAK